MNKKQAKEFIKALENIVSEKGIDKQIVIEGMEQAIAAACKKKYALPNVRATVNADTGEIRAYSFRNVIEGEVLNPLADISLEDAKKIVPDIEIGETIEEELEVADFGRVAAGTAKQIIVQRVKEAEKNLINDEFGDKQDEMLIGTLTREDANTYYVDLGRTCGILSKKDIIPGEKLEMGSTIKVYVTKVEIGTKGVFIQLSRRHFGFIKRLLELEIPEINDGTIMLYSVARDAGNRSKIAVYSDYSNIEPVGSVIGEKGRRINGILKQIGNEKIDVVKYDKNASEFIKNALSPAKDLKVLITDEDKKEAMVIANEENYSKAVGKKGINIQLASRLTKYKLTIKKDTEVDFEVL